MKQSLRWNAIFAGTMTMETGAIEPFRNASLMSNLIILSVPYAVQFVSDTNRHQQRRDSSLLCGKHPLYNS